MRKYVTILPQALDNHATLQYIYIMRHEDKMRSAIDNTASLRVHASPAISSPEIANLISVIFTLTGITYGYITTDMRDTGIASMVLVLSKHGRKPPRRTLPVIDAIIKAWGLGRGFAFTTEQGAES